MAEPQPSMQKTMENAKQRLKQVVGEVDRQKDLLTAFNQAIKRVKEKTVRADLQKEKGNLEQMLNELSAMGETTESEEFGQKIAELERRFFILLDQISDADVGAEHIQKILKRLESVEVAPTDAVEVAGAEDAIHREQKEQASKMAKVASEFYTKNRDKLLVGFKGVHATTEELREALANFLLTNQLSRNQLQRSMAKEGLTSKLSIDDKDLVAREVAQLIEMNGGLKLATAIEPVVEPAAPPAELAPPVAPVEEPPAEPVKAAEPEPEPELKAAVPDVEAVKAERLRLTQQFVNEFTDSVFEIVKGLSDDVRAERIKRLLDSDGSREHFEDITNLALDETNIAAAVRAISKEVKRREAEIPPEPAPEPGPGPAPADRKADAKTPEARAARADVRARDQEKVAKFIASFLDYRANFDKLLSLPSDKAREEFLATNWVAGDKIAQDFERATNGLRFNQRKFIQRMMEEFRRRAEKLPPVRPAVPEVGTGDATEEERLREKQLSYANGYLDHNFDFLLSTFDDDTEREDYLKDWLQNRADADLYKNVTGVELNAGNTDAVAAQIMFAFKQREQKLKEEKGPELGGLTPEQNRIIEEVEGKLVDDNYDKIANVSFEDLRKPFIEGLLKEESFQREILDRTGVPFQVTALEVDRVYDFFRNKQLAEFLKWKPSPGEYSGLDPDKLTAEEKNQIIDQIERQLIVDNYDDLSIMTSEEDQRDLIKSLLLGENFKKEMTNRTGLRIVNISREVDTVFGFYRDKRSAELVSLLDGEALLADTEDKHNEVVKLIKELIVTHYDNLKNVGSMTQRRDRARELLSAPDVQAQLQAVAGVQLDGDIMERAVDQTVQLFDEELWRRNQALLDGYREPERYREPEIPVPGEPRPAGGEKKEPAAADRTSMEQVLDDVKESYSENKDFVDLFAGKHESVDELADDLHDYFFGTDSEGESRDEDLFKNLDIKDAFDAHGVDYNGANKDLFIKALAEEMAQKENVLKTGTEGKRKEGTRMSLEKAKEQMRAVLDDVADLYLQDKNVTRLFVGQYESVDTLAGALHNFLFALDDHGNSKDGPGMKPEVKAAFASHKVAYDSANKNLFVSLLAERMARQEGMLQEQEEELGEKSRDGGKLTNEDIFWIEEETETLSPLESELRAARKQMAQAIMAKEKSSGIIVKGFNKLFGAKNKEKSKTLKEERLEENFDIAWERYRAAQEKLVAESENNLDMVVRVLEAEKGKLNSSLVEAYKGKEWLISKVWRKLGDCNVYNKMEELLAQVKEEKAERAAAGEEEGKVSNWGFSRESLAHQWEQARTGVIGKWGGKLVSARTAISSVLTGGAIAEVGTFLAVKVGWGAVAGTFGGRQAIDGMTNSFTERLGGRKKVYGSKEEMQEEYSKRGWWGRKSESMRRKIDLGGKTPADKLAVLGVEINNYQGWAAVNGVDLSKNEDYQRLLRLQQESLMEYTDEQLATAEEGEEIEVGGREAAILDGLLDSQREGLDKLGGNIKSEKRKRNVARILSLVTGGAVGYLAYLRAAGVAAREAADAAKTAAEKLAKGVTYKDIDVGSKEYVAPTKHDAAFAAKENAKFPSRVGVGRPAPADAGRPGAPSARADAGRPSPADTGKPGAAPAPEAAKQPLILKGETVPVKELGIADGKMITKDGPWTAGMELKKWFTEHGVKDWSNTEVVAELKKYGFTFKYDAQGHLVQETAPRMFYKGGAKLVPWVDTNGHGHFLIDQVKEGGIGKHSVVIDHTPKVEAPPVVKADVPVGRTPTDFGREHALRVKGLVEGGKQVGKGTEPWQNPKGAQPWDNTSADAERLLQKRLAGVPEKGGDLDGADDLPHEGGNYKLTAHLPKPGNPYYNPSYLEDARAIQSKLSYRQALADATHNDIDKYALLTAFDQYRDIIQNARWEDLHAFREFLTGGGVHEAAAPAPASILGADGQIDIKAATQIIQDELRAKHLLRATKGVGGNVTSHVESGPVKDIPIYTDKELTVLSKELGGGAAATEHPVAPSAPASATREMFGSAKEKLAQGAAAAKEKLAPVAPDSGVEQAISPAELVAKAVDMERSLANMLNSFAYSGNGASVAREFMDKVEMYVEAVKLGGHPELAQIIGKLDVANLPPAELEVLASKLKDVVGLSSNTDVLHRALQGAGGHLGGAHGGEYAAVVSEKPSHAIALVSHDDYRTVFEDDKSTFSIDDQGRAIMSNADGKFLASVELDSQGQPIVVPGEHLGGADSVGPTDTLKPAGMSTADAAPVAETNATSGVPGIEIVNGAPEIDTDTIMREWAQSLAKKVQILGDKAGFDRDIGNNLITRLSDSVDKLVAKGIVIAPKSTPAEILEQFKHQAVGGAKLIDAQRQFLAEMSAGDHPLLTSNGHSVKFFVKGHEYFVYNTNLTFSVLEKGHDASGAVIDTAGQLVASDGRGGVFFVNPVFSGDKVVDLELIPQNKMGMSVNPVSQGRG